MRRVTKGFLIDDPEAELRRRKAVELGRKYRKRRIPTQLQPSKRQEYEPTKRDIIRVETTKMQIRYRRNILLFRGEMGAVWLNRQDCGPGSCREPVKLPTRHQIQSGTIVHKQIEEEAFPMAATIEGPFSVWGKT